MEKKKMLLITRPPPRPTLVQNFLTLFGACIKNGENWVAAIAPWFRLRLQSAALGSNPKHTINAFFNLY